MAKKKKVEKKTPKFSRKLLEKVASEMNDEEIMGLNPAIEFEDLDDEELLEAIKENAVEDGEVQVFTTDPFSEDVKKFFANAGIEMGIAPAEEEEEAEEEIEEEQDDDEPVEDDDDDDEPVEEEEEEEEEEKPKKKAAAKKSAKAEKPKAKEGDKKPNPFARAYTRFHALVDAIKTGEEDKTALAELANELYVQNDGKDNVKEAKWSVGVAEKVLTALGFAKSRENKIILNK